MNSPSQILISHVIETLPGDVRRRREVLNSLLCVLPKVEIPDDLRTLLGDLDRHLVAQRELCLGFSAAVEQEVAPRGSGRLGVTPMERGGAVKGGRR